MLSYLIIWKPTALWVNCCIVPFGRYFIQHIIFSPVAYWLPFPRYINQKITAIKISFLLLDDCWFYTYFTLLLDIYDSTSRLIIVNLSLTRRSAADTFDFSVVLKIVVFIYLVVLIYLSTKNKPIWYNCY